MVDQLSLAAISTEESRIFHNFWSSKIVGERKTKRQRRKKKIEHRKEGQKARHFSLGTARTFNKYNSEQRACNLK
jgi:hypothetical protein